MLANRRNVVLIAIGAVAAVVIAALLLKPSTEAASSSTGAPSTTVGPGTSAPTASGPAATDLAPNPDASGDAVPTTAVGDPTVLTPTEPDPLDDVAAGSDAEPPIELPATVRVSATPDTGGGQTIEINVVPTSGSEVYGVEARLCRAGAAIAFDADMRPTQTGNCIAEPLTPETDMHVNVAGEPPYQSVDVVFHAGIGTNTYETQDGTPVSITCGPGSPCVLALKIQVPNGFGFKTYDVTYG